MTISGLFGEDIVGLCACTQDIPAKQYISEFTDWEKAFRAILDLPYGEKKKLIVIDEYPYMCKGNPSILSILQNLWGYRFERQ